MLVLEPYYRNAMLKKDILSVDERGEETLRGLTVMESVFILEFEGGGLIDAGVGEIMIYNHLIVRYHAAKILHNASMHEDGRQGEVVI
jgi:hypothetical protein